MDASSELSGTAHRPTLWVHLLSVSYNNTWCSAWKSQTRGNAENKMRPFFSFCSHVLSTPRKEQRWQHSVRPAGGPSGTGGRVQVGTRWMLWGTSANRPPSAHQLNFLGRFWTLPFPQTPKRQTVSIFVLYLPHEEPNLLFGSSSPRRLPQGIKHLFPFTEHSISSPNVLSRSYTQVGYEQKPWRRRQVGRELCLMKKKKNPRR